MRKILYLASVLCIVCSTSVRTMDGGSARFYSSPIATGTTLSPSVLSPLHAANANNSGSVIYIRYKGYTCSHCVRQLRYLNEHADALKRLGVSIVAFSSDDDATSNKMIAAQGLKTDVIHVVSDSDNDLARTIGALRVENDTARDLHAALVVRNGVLTFAAYTDEPFMDVERLISMATDRTRTGTATGSAANNVADNTDSEFGKGAAFGSGLRSYANGFTVRTIATAADGVREPKDLDFNSSPLHPNDLWVVLAEPNGHAMLIVHDADKASQVIRRKKDSRASHFMWRTQALAFGENGTFGTAQNGEPGNGDRDYQFMGPSLWSSDTAIFASKYQNDDNMLASHLDMLHQNAYCLGIAHERDNVYWISDALHKRIGRYDFRDPHEVGGTDHRDGEIRNYTNATITTSEHGRAAHMDFDDAKQWLYYINPGANAVMRLDTRTGKDVGALSTTPQSDENLTLFRNFSGATVQPVMQLTKDVRPVGLDIVGNHLIIGNTDGTILVYDIGGALPTLKHTLNVAPMVVGGVTVGPDGRIWFVDPVNATVNVVDPDLKESIVATDVARVTATAVKMSMVHGIVRPNCDIASYRISTEAPKGWTIVSPDSVTVTAAGSPDFTVTATPDSTALTGQLTVRATSKDGSVLTTHVLISRSDLRRVLVDDATTEGFDFVDAVAQTARKGYSPMTSDIFLRLIDSIPDIQTVVWNAGSFGEINTVEDAILNYLVGAGREVMLVADDPLLLRTDLPDASAFFSLFGSSLLGADVPSGNDDGRRVLQGAPGDPITGGMTGIECELPRLNHTRGNQYVPNVKLSLDKPNAFGVLKRSNNTITTAIRYDATSYRTVLCGINAARFLDASERTTFLDKSIAWLELAETPIPTTGVASEVVVAPVGQLQTVGPNPFSDLTKVRVTTTTPYADIALYSIAGQRIATLWQGAVEGSVDLDVNGRSISNGTYYVIMRSGGTISHCTIIKRN
ncbi:MAG: redoxin family protein [bacterium]|nr:redoxin family protein [bacterium]